MRDAEKIAAEGGVWAEVCAANIVNALKKGEEINPAVLNALGIPPSTPSK